MKITKLTIRDDYPSAIAVKPNANINCYGFNIDFIAERDPYLAVELFEIWHKAKLLQVKKPINKDSIIFTKANKQLQLLIDKYEL